jgi:serine/threonine-protein kinase mTOR
MAIRYCKIIIIVIPQLIARVHSDIPAVRRLVHDLLSKIGKAHPQALIYPFTVCAKSKTQKRRAAAETLLDKMRIHSSILVDQALLVSDELIRIAILWPELWHEGLDEASRLYFQEHDIKFMLEVLGQLHKTLDKAETLSEIAFQQVYGRDLQEAFEW